MTSPPSTPNLRRRRIVVAIGVLALGMGWWFWPRVDQRFVGKWMALTVSDERGKYFGQFEFASNGTMGLVDASGAESRTVWRIENDKLIVGSELSTLLHPFGYAVAAIRRFSGNSTWGAREVWSINQISEGGIRLKKPRDWDRPIEIVLRRTE
jgi:hypothetical protein